MRALVLAIAAVMMAVFTTSLALIPAVAAAPPAIPTLSVTVLGQSPAGAPVFQTEGLTQTGQILIPQVPIRVNLTFINNESVATGMGLHTFTIDDSGGDHMIDIPLQPQTNYTLEFTINSMTNVTINGTSFTPVAGPLGGIQYYCIPHRALGMVGEIILASATQQAAPPEKGINIRAYWIGMIGIISMIVWIGISYFVVKTSSPHFKDHKEHVRKGLP
jgi:hypothetical protein